MRAKVITVEELLSALKEAEEHCTYVALAHDHDGEVEVCSICEGVEHKPECPFAILNHAPVST